MKQRKKLLVLALIVCIALAGCGQKSAQERFVLVGCDNSGSVGKKGVKEYTSRILEPVMEEENGSFLKMYLFTHRPDVIYESRVSEVEDIYGTIDRYVIGAGISGDQFTYYSPILKKWAEEARSRPKAQVVGILLTDGDCFDQKEATKVARELASQPNFVVLYVAPVRNGAIRSQIEHTLYPLKVKGKLIISGDNDILGAVDEFHQKERK